ncbi:MAG: pyruvate kinase, partial [Ignavibacteria bacterium RIFOXYA2_FULL_37_17]
MSTRLTEVFSKTKILCTLGPSTYTTEDIEKLILAGMDGVRLNFSHGDYDFYEKVFQNIYNACVEEKTPLAVLIDLQGPKIRIGELAELEIELITGEKIEITTENIKGTKARISTSYKRLVEDAAIGDAILIDDGLIRLRITGKKKDSVICEIENGDILKPKKGMNLPGMKISAQAVTEKDYRDLEFALSKRADFIALSFVRSANDIIILREWLKSKNNIKPIIAKIEKKEAVENFDEILEAADGIMVARGDLGVELLPQEVPVIQKMIIKKCNAIGKLVITATQMLESMIHNPIPTRAEASDVANAVWDGTDVVMLSGETSVGKFPLRSVQIMNDILKNTEFHLRPVQETELKIPESIEENLFDSVGRAISSISRQVKAEAIVTFTYKGRTAKNLSKFRPEAKIIALSNNFEIMNRLCLRWGVTSIYMEDIDKEKIAVDKAKKLILENGQVKEGDM